MPATVPMPPYKAHARLADLGKDTRKDDKPRRSLAELASETWPAQMAREAYNAFTLPGDVYAGRAKADEIVPRAASLAGLATLGAGAFPAEAGAVNMGIRAYHGSPHSFDKFSLSKIGTGEGAQAYGHGLYFAENPKVAEAYKGVQGMASSDPMPNVASKQLQAYGDTSEMREMMRLVFPSASNDEIEAAISTAKKTPSGSMYEVNINADPDQFLDWDNGGEAAYRAAILNADNSRDALKQKYGEEALFASPSELARRELVEKGIPGIKYLDAGSRGAGDGSRNYVVFDDSLIEIVRKYGLAALAPILGGATLVGKGGTPLSAEEADAIARGDLS